MQPNISVASFPGRLSLRLCDRTRDFESCMQSITYNVERQPSKEGIGTRVI